jgi:hypothetical protein
MKNKLPKGMVLHETTDIVVIATKDSINDKTDNMIQVWILLKNIRPTEGLKTGEDERICFDCTHRRNKTCYVNVGQAPQQVWKSYKRGLYPELDYSVLKEMVTGREIRFGAYGEPVLIPLEIVRFMAFNSKGWTGYTHQWHQLKFDDYKHFFMASADGTGDVMQAHMMGWRTFRVAPTDEEELLDHEVICPNITHGVKCKTCLLCDGAGVKKSIVVPVHGTKGKINTFNNLQTL